MEVKMNIVLKKEEEKDFFDVEKLTREAFWNVYRPGCCEHLVLHKLRKSRSFIPELDFIALDNKKIVGNIVYSKGKIVNSNRKEHNVLTFGPISVLPSHQKKGIGSKLISHTIKIAQDLGFKAIIIFGDPNYYKRFGFENAEKFNIQTSDGANFDAFMVKELYKGSLDDIYGNFYQDNSFHVEDEEVEEFDKKFVNITEIPSLN